MTEIIHLKVQCNNHSDNSTKTYVFKQINFYPAALQFVKMGVLHNPGNVIPFPGIYHSPSHLSVGGA